MRTKNLSKFIAILILLNSFISPAKAQVFTLDQGLAELTKQLVDNSQLPIRARLSVLPLIDYKNKETRFGNYFAEELTTRLFGYQRFDLVEKQLLDKAIREIKLQNPKAGITDPKTAIKLGEMLNSEAILVGSYEDIGNTRKINARIISVKYGIVLSAAGVEIEKAKISEETNSTIDEKSGAIVEINKIIYFGGDWPTVTFNSIELVGVSFLQFNFSVHNPFEDDISLRLDRPQENTYLVDGFGNSYDYVSSKGIYGDRNLQIRQGVRVSFSIIFKVPTSSANYVTIRTEWTAWGISVNGTKKFVEKNLRVPGR